MLTTVRMLIHVEDHVVYNFERKRKGEFGDFAIFLPRSIHFRLFKNYLFLLDLFPFVFFEVMKRKDKQQQFISTQILRNIAEKLKGDHSENTATVRGKGLKRWKRCGTGR